MNRSRNWHANFTSLSKAAIRLRIADALGISKERLAAWKEEVVDATAPAKNTTKEKPMTDIAVLARLDEVELRMLRAAIDTRLELLEKPNAGHNRAARTSRKTA